MLKSVVFAIDFIFLPSNIRLLKKLNELVINLTKGIVIFKRKCYNDRQENTKEGAPL